MTLQIIVYFIFIMDIENTIGFHKFAVLEFSIIRRRFNTKKNDLNNQ